MLFAETETIYKERTNEVGQLQTVACPLCQFTVRISVLLDHWLPATKVSNEVELTDPWSNCCSSEVDIEARLSALVSASGWSTAEITTSSNGDFVRRRRNLRFFRSADQTMKLFEFGEYSE